MRNLWQWVKAALTSATGQGELWRTAKPVTGTDCLERRHLHVYGSANDLIRAVLSGKEVYITSLKV